MANRMTVVATLLGALLLTGCSHQRPPHLPASPTQIPPAPSGPGSFRFVVLSDMNGPYGSTQYSRNVKDSVALIADRLKPEIAVSAGDLVAGQKRGLTAEQIRANRVKQVVAIERELVDDRQRSGRAFDFGYCYRAIERNDRARIDRE